MSEPTTNAERRQSLHGNAAFQPLRFPRGYSILRFHGSSRDRCSRYNVTGANSGSIVARPVTYGYSVCSVYTDESGVVRYTTEDRPATAQDRDVLERRRWGFFPR